MPNPLQAHDFLRWAQLKLEEFYGAPTELDVRNFVMTVPDFKSLGGLKIEQDSFNGDLNLALYLDRDMFSAWTSAQCLQKRPLSVLLEESSHFVYLSFNHRRQRNISHLEMELQSEVDRIVLAFHDQAPISLKMLSQELLVELHEAPYASSQDLITYEKARRWASLFLKRLNDEGPSEWASKELSQLRRFFHLDLSEKIHFLRLLGEARVSNGKL